MRGGEQCDSDRGEGRVTLVSWKGEVWRSGFTGLSVGHIGFTEDRVGHIGFKEVMGGTHSGFKKIRGGTQWF